MVYHGVPSAGCFLCRKRKIKCDEAKPFCTRCQKSKRVCPGYPAPPDARSMPRLQDPKAYATDTELSSSCVAQKIGGAGARVQCWLVDAANCRSQVSPLGATLRQSTIDAARCHFLSNFVLISPSGTNRGLFEFTISLLKTEPCGEAYSMAFKACSLASLAYCQGLDTVLEQQALLYYDRALKATYHALTNTNAAVSDGVLGAILLLAMFELKSGSNEYALGWGSHIVGSSTLMKNRGQEQLATGVGTSIFVAVRAQLILLAMITGRVAPLGPDWFGEGTYRDKHAAVCLQLTARTTELREKLNNYLYYQEQSGIMNTSELSQLSRDCRAADFGFVLWSQAAPEYFHYTMATWINDEPDNLQNAEALPGSVHIYGSPWLACLWNMVRCSRLELAGLILRCAALMGGPNDYRTLPEYEPLTRTCIGVVSKIVASIPYQLGWFEKHNHLLVARPQFACGENSTKSELAAAIAIWPLARVQEYDSSTEAQRVWAQGRLEYIGARRGIRAATLQARVIHPTLGCVIVCSLN
ncbi:hypothetical protein NLG97_g3034 [Lecanicillium saksenae]|uniref:Uncharacterized protein n=1 Tax=Lecanicillium saksenae TaxID=468837 RepID=A0ACC1R1X2_9HYPO|nr:hypothetical protein NLG97_g3034 [Lecanicillium saksenae]